MPAIEAQSDLCLPACGQQEIVTIAKKEALPEPKACQVAQIFKLLGDTARVKILQSLSSRELCVCELAAILEMSQPAISSQLRLLRNAQLVKCRRQGKLIHYSLDDSHVHALLAQSIAHIEHR